MGMSERPPHKLFRLLVLGGAVLATAPACGGGQSSNGPPGTSAGSVSGQSGGSSDGGVDEGREPRGGTGPGMW